MIENNINTDQQQLEEVGSNLQRIRLSKEISLDSVANNTHISKRLLTAIEAGDIQELPEPFYVKALVAKFAQELGAKIEFEPNSSIGGEMVKADNDPKIRRRKLNFQLRSPHLYLMYILLVILSVRGIALLVERPVIVQQIPAEVPAIDSQVARVETPTPTTSTTTVPQYVSQSSTPDSVTVGIDLQERCWLKVMVDGKSAFEGTLPKGTKRQWTGDRQVTIRAGNAGGVAISFNNEQQKVLGAPGQVEEITYTVN